MDKKCIEIKKWSVKEAQQACNELAEGGWIRVFQENGIENLSILDEHFFSKRGDACLDVYISAESDEFFNALANMRNLNDLNLNILEKGNYSTLRVPTNISSLTIRPCVDIAIDFIAECKMLEYLSVEANPAVKGVKMGNIKSFAPVAACKNIKALSLVCVKGADFSFAKSMKIERIYLSKVTSYKNFTDLFTDSLKKLFIADMYTFTDLSFLASCTNLENLSLYRTTGITSLEGIPNPQSLRILSIDSVKTIEDLTLLSKTINLEDLALQFSGGKTDKKQLGKMIISLPALKSVYFLFESMSFYRTLKQMLEDAGKGDLIR